MTDWTSHAGRLADMLDTQGAIREPAWREVFARTPRHVFVPRFFALDEFNQPRHVIDGDNPQQVAQWLERVYSSEILVTHYRVIGSMPDGTEIRVASSSASAPRIVAVMLDRLEIADGHRVLEIGTGTGYHAALLASRLGDDQVTSIEVDPVAAAEAGDRLAAANHLPTLVVGDGSQGYPPRAPYDRIIATCAVQRIPSAWISQLSEGGIIVAPLSLGGGPLAVLRKLGQNQVAGHLDAEPAYFMTMSQTGERAAGAAGAPSIPELRQATSTMTTRVERQAWASRDFHLWLSLHQQEVSVADRLDSSGNRCGVTVYTSSDRATVDYPAGHAPSQGRVVQGRTRLWMTVEAAWREWLGHGRPARTRIGISATGDGEQYAWLDRPDGPLRWPLHLPQSQPDD